MTTHSTLAANLASGHGHGRAHPWVVAGAGALASRGAAWPAPRQSSAGFAILRDAYRSTGGVARGDDLARLLEDHHLGDFVSLARLMASNAVFGFEWGESMWIPMFQFDLRDLSVRDGQRRLLEALASDVEPWALAHWLVRPHPLLWGWRPVDRIDANPGDVLEAACSDGGSTGPFEPV